jgi:N-methylhydantoinase A/oxoprolinase/acetone carboxylase beta subunit
MARRIGLDIGGTFTDVVLATRDRSHRARQDPDHALLEKAARRNYGIAD